MDPYPDISDSDLSQSINHYPDSGSGKKSYWDPDKRTQVRSTEPYTACSNFSERGADFSQECTIHCIENITDPHLPLCFLT